MKILAITQSKDILGGANRSFLDVLQSLKDDYAHEIFVITPGEGDFTRELKNKGIPYISLDYCQTSTMSVGNWKSAASYILTVLECRKNKKAARTVSPQLQNQFDIVYINDTTNSFGFYLAHNLNIPFVWHFRGYNQTLHRYMPITDEKQLIRDPNGTIIAISKAMMDFMVRIRGLRREQICVVYNGVVNPGIRIQQPWSENIKDELHCLHCGHLSKAKGQLDSIRALGELKRKGYTHVFLHLAGTPAVSHGKSYDEELKRVAEEENVSDHVIFEGEIKNMAEFRKNMHIELMCSLAEPFGRVTVEGMQAGLVMIGCDTGATPEIIQDGSNGLIYHQGDYVSLANCIERVYKDRELGNRLSAEAIQFSDSHFTMEENVREINKVLCAAKEYRNELS